MKNGRPIESISTWSHNDPIPIFTEILLLYPKKAITLLAQNPYKLKSNYEAKPLKNGKLAAGHLWSLKLGRHYRMAYIIDEKNDTIIMLYLGPRQNFYETAIRLGKNI